MPDVECLGSVTGVRIENLKLLYDEHSNCANVRLSVGGLRCKTVGRVSKDKKKKIIVCAPLRNQPVVIRKS